MNDTEIRQRREDFALATFQTLLAANPTKTWSTLAHNAVKASDTLIAVLDAPEPRNHQEP